jgi:hypothetical protein
MYTGREAENCKEHQCGFSQKRVSMMLMEAERQDTRPAPKFNKFALLPSVPFHARCYDESAIPPEPMR